MKRFHVHVSVTDISAGTRFYQSVFGQEPAVAKPDYVKWMLDQPPLNFAISSGRKPGVNHLGFQVDSGEDLQAMRAQLQTADREIVEEQGVSCCYSRSDKYWVTDPAGIAWETFRSLGAVAIYGDDHAPEVDACCSPGATQPSGAQACCA